MVWPVRSLNWRKVSASNGAEPLMNRRIVRHASALNAGSASSLTYSVGTPMKTVASGSRAMTARGSNFENQIILLPLSSAPCTATNRPCTWNSGSAWISTSPPSEAERQPHSICSTRALLSRLPWLSIAPLLRPVVPLV